MKTPHCGRVSGLSLPELIILLAVIGILAAAGVATIGGGGTLHAAREAKLEHDLRVLNSAVSSYLASGGDLSKAAGPGDVLVRLKTRVSDEQRRRMPGLGGSFLDATVEFEFQDEAQGESGELRLHWAGDKQRFELSESGGPGIRGIRMSRTGMVATSDQEEERNTGMQFSAKSTWIWDYQDQPLPSSPGVSAIPTGVPVSSTPPSSTGGVSPSAKGVLQAPILSIPGGKFPEYDFPLSLTITDPNPAGAGQVYYSANYGPWVRNLPGETVSVSPETSIKAQVVPLDPDVWNASTVVEEIYHSFDVKLLPPGIEFDQPHFITGNSATVNTITVTLSNPNEAGTSSVLYQLLPVPGGSGATTGFLPYGGPFSVSSTDYPGGFGVKAYASAAKVGYEDSRINSRFATEVTGVFGGHLDLDTSTTLADIASGNTDAHTHDITGKYGINSLDFFAIPEGKQIEIDEAITNPGQKFKLTVVNADLSPGMSLLIDYEVNGVNRVIDTTVGRYDDTPIGELATFSMGGTAGSAKLNRVTLTMSQDVIHEAGVIPTTTGDVVANILGKGNEWRNGSLTVQAVAVNPDGTDGFATDAGLSSRDHGAARSGLLWEAALFWHWDGESYDDDRNQYVPGQVNSVSNHIED